MRGKACPRETLQEARKGKGGSQEPQMKSAIHTIFAFGFGLDILPSAAETEIMIPGGTCLVISFTSERNTECR